MIIDTKSHTSGNSPSFSIVVPLYNKQATVEKTIQSVLSQHYPNFELIIVNDETPDRSMEVVRRYETQLKIVEQKNSGPSRARNHGASVATYSHLVFLDADDILLPGCLTTFSELIGEFQSPLIMCAWKNQPPEGDIEINIPQPCLGSLESPRACQTNEFHSTLVTGVQLGSFCLEHSLFDKAGGFCEKLRCWEVTDFLFRIGLEKPEITTFPRAVMLAERDVATSQFLNHFKDTDQKDLFLQRVLTHLQDIPVSERRVFVKTCLDLLNQYLETHQIQEFINLYRITKCFLSPRERVRLQTKKLLTCLKA